MDSYHVYLSPKAKVMLDRTSRFKMAELPTEIARVVETLDVGEISKAFTMLDKAGKEQCVIIKLKNL